MESIEYKMDATYRKEKSFHGHSIDVLKSGLQKYVRRGNVEAAMYCLGELDLFSECEGGERIRTNMIHRLMTIYMEDIGLGGVKSWARVDELVFGWLKDRSQTRLIQELVQLLCAAKKTRACSFARVYSNSLKQPRCEEFEKQVEEKDWFCIKTLLQKVEQKSYLTEYKKAAQEMKSAGVEDIDIALRWIREVKTRERPLFFLLPLLHHLFGGYAFEPVVPVFDDNWKTHRSLSARVFDDYVYDKHTRTGVRDRGFFVNVSSKVENEVFVLPACFAAKYYGKSSENDKQMETEYELVVRCQLVCSKTKTDSVIARKPGGGELVFLKGPYKTDEPVKFFLRMQEEKARRSMPAVKGKLVYLVPDRWGETPLGVRNSLDLSRPWPFLETSLVFEEKDIVLKKKSSNLWPETEVLDCEAMKLTIDPLKLVGAQLDDYVRAVRFREEFRIGDFADRNFLLGKDGRIYSVDEESAAKVPIDLEKQLRKKRFELVCKHQ